MTDVQEIHLPDTIDVKPIASPDGTGPKRARSAGRIHSLLRVRSMDSEEEIYIGLALLRLEMLDRPLSVGFQQDSQDSEAGVNSAGGLVEKPKVHRPEGQWLIRPFNESLANAK